MYWIILVVSGLFEAVWANALDKSNGFTRLVPTLVFFVSSGLSLAGLSFALKEIPVGTGYAVWVAVGMVATITYAFLTGAEMVSPLKLLFLAMIIGGVIGLKLTH
ncbi:multidrug efflux SMR transporter [Rothia sp. LK2588]|uniref:multidrug efflux SMR transporter n=1 Tax=Rothia sp. LK2588 TaxID=3114369 RepID=UPI0034CFE9DC